MPPIFEYQCERCPVRFSVLTRFENRNDTQTCPNCNEQDNRLVMSATRTTFTFADKCAEKRIRPPKRSKR